MRSLIQEFYGKRSLDELSGARIACVNLEHRILFDFEVPVTFKSVGIATRHASVYGSWIFLAAFVLLTVHAQTSPPQAAVVDPGLLARANAGDAAAQLQVADVYAAGKDSKPDYKQAAVWYRKAADQGNLAAEVHLADFYRDGRGVTRDMTQATDWYRKAGDAGDVSAQGSLGILYSLGTGVARDDVEAYYWLCLAASQKGPNQARYITNRQSVGEHITTDQQAAVEERVAKWQAAHPH